jgi:hypothetical protein
MGRKPQVQTRLPEETYEDFEKYRDNRDMTDAEATRTLMKAGLDAEPIDSEPTTRVFDSALSLQRLWALSVTLALLVLLVAEVGL